MDCTCPACAKAAIPIKLAKQKPKFNREAFDKAIKHLHDTGDFTPEMLNDVPIKALTRETGKILSAAVSSGIADNDIPPAMRRALSDNVFLFSGFKTYRQLKEASTLLTAGDGKIKPFGQFYKDVKKLDATYNKNYLEAEYQFAVASAQQAANWADIEKDGDRYDLRYRTAEDDRVRQSHATLNNIVLPPSETFWDKYYPPNGWRCRCKATQVLKGNHERSDPAMAMAKGDEATTKIGKDGRNALAIFRFNPGKQQVIFPPHHPYKPKGEEGKKVAEIISEALKPEDRTADYEKYKADENYTDVQMNKIGGLKATHVLHNFDKESGRFEKEARDILFNNGYKVILEKELPEKGEIAKTGVKHVDGMLNDFTYEQRTIFGDGEGTIKRALRHAKQKEAQVAVLYFPNNTLYSEVRVRQGVSGFHGRYEYRFKKIIVLVDNNVREME